MSVKNFRQALYGLFITGLLFAYLGRYSHLDLRMADWMYNAPEQTFPWKDSWFAAVFMHKWVKYFFIGIGLAMINLMIVDYWKSFGLLTGDVRRKTAVVVMSFIAVPLVVSLIKSQSIHHCPWDIQRYGGLAPYLRLFDSLPDEVKAGHCFPGGHASSGLWLAAFAVFCLPNRPRMAFVMFAIGLFPGLALGWVQQLRGAHFLSHTLWSAWVAGAVILLFVRLLLGVRSVGCSGT